MKFMLGLSPDVRLLRGLLRTLRAVPEAGDTQWEVDTINQHLPETIAEMPDAELLSLWRAAVGGIDDDDKLQ